MLVLFILRFYSQSFMFLCAVSLWYLSSSHWRVTTVKQAQNKNLCSLCIRCIWVNIGEKLEVYLIAKTTIFQHNIIEHKKIRQPNDEWLKMNSLSRPKPGFVIKESKGVTWAKALWVLVENLYLSSCLAPKKPIEPGRMLWVCLHCSTTRLSHV